MPLQFYWPVFGYITSKKPGSISLEVADRLETKHSEWEIDRAAPRNNNYNDGTT